MESTGAVRLDAAIAAVEAVLRSGLTDRDLALVDDEDLLSALSMADRVVSYASAARATVIRQAEARQTASLVAKSTTAEWLRRGHGHTAQRCRLLVREALRGERFPLVTSAEAEGLVGGEQGAAIVRVLSDLPADLSNEQLAAAQNTMIGFAADFDPVELAGLARHLLEVIAPERADELLAEKLATEEEKARKDRGFSMRFDGHGKCRFSGVLPAADGEELAAQLNARAETAWKDQADATKAGGMVPLTKEQLRADALMGLVRGAAAHRDAPAHGGDRPRVMLLLDFDALLGGLGRMVLTGGSFVSAAEARRLACDCDLIPAVCNALGVPLDVGREHRLVTPHLRAALAARDGGCVFPGCDRAPAECEAHHVWPWWAGGGTRLENLVLLCPRHHRLCEPGAGQPWDQDDPHRWMIRVAADGLPEVTPPLGYDPARKVRRHARYAIRQL